MILLNPGPSNTTESVKRALVQPDICPREPAFGALLLDVRARLTRIVHAADRYTTVIFSSSGTGAVEAAIASCVPSAVDGGKLLVIDNGAYGARLAEIARAYGIQHSVERTPPTASPDLARIGARLRSEQYSHLAVVHHETSSGMLNPVGSIAELCRPTNTAVIVDAMSSYGGIPIDVEHSGIDYLIASSNKCLQGMPGLGFVVCRRRCLDSLEDTPGRSYYLNLRRQHQFLERHGQMQFTPPVPIVYALDAALTELAREGGSAARRQRYDRCFTALDAGMLALGFRRVLHEAQLSRILTAYWEPDHPNYRFDALHDSLYAKGFTIYPGKGAPEGSFRLANMGAIDVPEIEDFLSALAATLSELGLRPLYAAHSG